MPDDSTAVTFESLLTQEAMKAAISTDEAKYNAVSKKEESTGEKSESAPRITAKKDIQQTGTLRQSTILFLDVKIFIIKICPIYKMLYKKSKHKNMNIIK